MNILGIGSGLKLGHHDGSAALVINNNLGAAAEEERFLRIKQSIWQTNGRRWDMHNWLRDKARTEYCTWYRVAI